MHKWIDTLCNRCSNTTHGIISFSVDMGITFANMLLATWWMQLQSSMYRQEFISTSDPFHIFTQFWISVKIFTMAAKVVLSVAHGETSDYKSLCNKERKSGLHSACIMLCGNHIWTWPCTLNTITSQLCVLKVCDLWFIYKSGLYKTKSLSPWCYKTQRRKYRVVNH